MSFKEAKVTKLVCQRINGDWFTDLGGDRVGLDWDDGIYDEDWDYTRNGVKGKLIFLEVHGGDDPYFSSQKDADKQLLTTMNLNYDHAFIKHIYVFKGEHEINLVDVLIPDKG